MAKNGQLNWGSYHISSNLKDYEVARSNFFTLVVHDLDGIVRSDFGEVEPQEADRINNAQEVLKLSVTKASVPHFDIDVIEVRRGNSVIKYAGLPKFDAGSVEVQDYVGLRTKDALMAWQAAAYDVVNDFGGRAVNYKKNCTLYEYTQDFEEIRHWELIGCFITGITEDDFDVAGDGDRKLSATIQYDRAIMHLPDDYQA